MNSSKASKTIKNQELFRAWDLNLLYTSRIKLSTNPKRKNQQIIQRSTMNQLVIQSIKIAHQAQL